MIKTYISKVFVHNAFEKIMTIFWWVYFQIISLLKEDKK
jgi:hypothetical protein